MTVFVADIASYQHGLNLAALRPDCVGVEIKCTEGAGYVNPDYAGWLVQAKSAALVTVAYHYVNGDAPAAQAANLAANIGDKSLPVMLDIELGSGNLPHVLEVTDAMTSAGLHPKLLYFPEWYWQQVGAPALAAPLGSRGLLLVSAHYPSMVSGSPATLYPGDASPLWNGYGGIELVTLLQFTDAALEGGQKVDMNAYRGTETALRTALGAPVPPHPPVPPPAWPGRTFVYTQGRALMSGADVRVWQTRMRARGWTITVDGFYGPQSAGVCHAFQVDSSAHGWLLAEDSMVGPKTWTASWERPIS